MAAAGSIGGNMTPAAGTLEGNDHQVLISIGVALATSFWWRIVPVGSDTVGPAAQGQKMVPAPNTAVRTASVARAPAGAAGGAIAGGGKGAGTGAAIGGLVGTGGGTLYGLNENRRYDERYRDACAAWMGWRGHTG
jgi:hypothetical protein